MSLTLEQITKEALELPPISRAELAEKLVGSLDAGQDESLRAQWSAEAIQRRDEVRSGAVISIPGEQVRAEIRRLVGR